MSSLALVARQQAPIAGGGVQVMHCAAAPIRDVRGRVAGVLDLSSESRPFGFDAAAYFLHADVKVGVLAGEVRGRILGRELHSWSG